MHNPAVRLGADGVFDLVLSKLIYWWKLNVGTEQLPF